MAALESDLGWLALAAVVVGAFWWADRHTKRQLQQREDASPATGAPEGGPRPPTEEDIALQAALVRRELEVREAKERDRAFKEQEADQKKIQRARTLVQTSGVGDAALRLWEEMKNWPSWSKKDWKPPLPVEGLEGESIRREPDHHAERGAWVGWTIGGVAFRNELTTSPAYMGEGRYGSLTLSVDGVEVLTLGVAEDYDTHMGAVYRHHEVKALKVGPWMVALNEFYGAVLAAKNKRARDDAAERLRKQADQITL